jgi:uncharacterized coiled-coil protein SlyX
MATTNQERQAAFKTKMRQLGKRQATVWVDAAQHEAIKAYLQGEEPLDEPTGRDQSRFQEWEARLAEQEARLQARAERVDSLWQTHEALVNEIKELKRQLASVRQQAKPARSFKVVELADRRDRIADAMRVGSYSKTERRVDDLEQQVGLSKKFSTEIKGTKSRLHGFVDVAAGKKAVTHKREWGAYSFDKSILTESEADLLLEACALLGRIENDVERAGSDITKLHAQRAAERKALFAKTESALNDSLFQGLDRRGEILFIAAMNGSGRGFGKWADLLDRLDGRDTWRRESAASLFREALAEEKGSLYRKIVDILMSGEKKLDEMVAGIVEKYRHPDTEEKYGALADRLTTFLVAEQIEKASRP